MILATNPLKIFAMNNLFVNVLCPCMDHRFERSYLWL